MSLQSLIPNEPRPGQPLSATWGAAVIRVLRAMCPIPGNGTLLSTSPNGTSVSVRQSRRSRDGDEAEGTAPDRYLYPNLTTMPAPDPLPEGYTPVPAWSVTPGTVNSVFPTTASGTVGKNAEGKHTTDVRQWAVPFGDYGDYAGIYVKMEYTMGDDGYIEWTPSIVLLPWTGVSGPTHDTPEIGYWRIGSVQKGNTEGKHTVFPNNNQNLTARQIGFGWDWGAISLYGSNETF